MGGMQCTFNHPSNKHYRLVVEVKCHFRKMTKMVLTLITKIPHYYICPVLSERNAHNVVECWYVCYTSQCTTLCGVTFNEVVWKKVFTLCKKLYSHPDIQIPACLLTQSKELWELLKPFIYTDNTFIAEAPSIHGQQGVLVHSSHHSPCTENALLHRYHQFR